MVEMTSSKADLEQRLCRSAAEGDLHSVKELIEQNICDNVNNYDQVRSIPARPISSSSPSACSHRPPFSHAEIAALYAMVLRSIPARPNSSSSHRAVCQTHINCPPPLHIFSPLCGGSPLPDSLPVGISGRHYTWPHPTGTCR